MMDPLECASSCGYVAVRACGCHSSLDIDVPVACVREQTCDIGGIGFI